MRLRSFPCPCRWRKWCRGYRLQWNTREAWRRRAWGWERRFPWSCSRCSPRRCRRQLWWPAGRGGTMCGSSRAEPAGRSCRPPPSCLWADGSRSGRRHILSGAALRWCAWRPGCCGAILRGSHRVRRWFLHRRESGRWPSRGG